MRSLPTRRRRDDHGTVTAEAAVTLPVVVAVVLLLAWMLSLGIAEVRTVDAARDGAREAARGDSPAAVRQAVQRSAPDGAQVSIQRDGANVAVTVSLAAQAPGWLLVPLPVVHLGSTSTVEVEADDTAG